MLLANSNPDAEERATSAAKWLIVVRSTMTGFPIIILITAREASFSLIIFFSE